MQLTIKHRTRYQYARAIELQPHRLIITPRDSGELFTVRRSLECMPPADVAWSADVFGNLIATVTFADRTSELTIISEAVVDHTAPEWPIFAIYA